MNFGELTGCQALGSAGAGGNGRASAALYYTVFKSQRDANAAAQTKLQAKMRENAELEAYRPKLADIERQLASLKQQLEIERPHRARREGSGQLHAHGERGSAQGGRGNPALHGAAGSARDFYTEVPFEVELDGPYYSMLGFFDRVSKLERIVNVSNLLVATTRKPGDAKAKHTYQYAPNESVVATCVTTTYFSHDSGSGRGAAKPGAGEEIRGTR